MKKLKLLIVTAFATLFVAVGVSAVVAFAEESAGMNIESAETVDNEGMNEIFSIYYHYAIDETHFCRIDLIDEERASLRVIEKFGDGSSDIAKISVDYMLSTEYNQLWLWFEDELLSVFTIQEDNSLVDITPIPDTEAIIPSEKEDINTVLLPVVCGIVGLLGSCLLFLVFRGKLDKLKKAFSDIVSWFTKKKEELATEEIDLKKFKNDLTEAVSSNEEIKALLQQAYENNKAQYLAFKQAIEDAVKTAADMVSTMKTNFEANAAEIQKQYEQIREILIKMVVGDAELVRKGIADDIVKAFEKKKE